MSKATCSISDGKKGITTSANAISQNTLANDRSLGARLHERLTDHDLVLQVVSQCKSLCTNVEEMSYLLLGNYLKNRIDISQLFHDSTYFV